jgi:hypothetical protein
MTQFDKFCADSIAELRRLRRAKYADVKEEAIRAESVPTKGAKYKRLVAPDVSKIGIGKRRKATKEQLQRSFGEYVSKVDAKSVERANLAATNAILKRYGVEEIDC